MRTLIGLILISLLFGAGCYKRITVPSYQYDESKLEGIRKQLGVKTAEKEYTNLDEEDE